MLSSIMKRVLSGWGIVSLGVLLIILSAPGLFLQPVKMDQLQGHIVGHSPLSLDGSAPDGTKPDGIGFHCSPPSPHCAPLQLDTVIEFGCDSAIISGRATSAPCPPAPTRNEYVLNSVDFHPQISWDELAADPAFTPYYVEQIWVEHGGNRVYAIHVFPAVGSGQYSVGRLSEQYYATDIYEAEYGMCADCNWSTNYGLHWYAYHAAPYAPYLAGSGVALLAIGLVWLRLPWVRARKARSASRSGLDGNESRRV